MALEDIDLSYKDKAPGEFKRYPTTRPTIVENILESSYDSRNGHDQEKEECGYSEVPKDQLSGLESEIVTSLDKKLEWGWRFRQIRKSGEDNHFVVIYQRKIDSSRISAFDFGAYEVRDELYVELAERSMTDAARSRGYKITFDSSYEEIKLLDNSLVTDPNLLMVEVNLFELNPTK